MYEDIYTKRQREKSCWMLYILLLIDSKVAGSYMSRGG